MKRNFQIVLDENVHSKIKAQAALNRLTIGEYIAALEQMRETVRCMDYVFQQRFNTLLEQSILDASNKEQGGWSGEDGFDFAAKAREVQRQEEKEHGGG